MRVRRVVVRVVPGHAGVVRASRDGLSGEVETGSTFPVVVHAPFARRVELLIDGRDRAVELERSGGAWTGDVAVGDRYVVVVDGRTPVLHPHATEVWFPDGHSRAARRSDSGDLGDALDTFPRAVATPWPTPSGSRATSRPLVVYEAHVRGLTRRRRRADAGTYRAAIDELPRLASLGVSVLELLPVHQYDPDEGNYWGYMPLVFGAIHRQYAHGADAAAELAALVTAAHRHDIEVWLDVVVNHTTEEGVDGPTYHLRALDEREYYVERPDGTHVDDAGTGNIVDSRSPFARGLVMESLERLADLGVDGFRFDLAAVLARDADFVRSIGDWAERRGVRLVAEPWDLARYLLGPDFPDQRWMQWNGRYRDDVRGFLRGEPGLVPAVMQRVSGSPDLFSSPAHSVNFVTSHDGFTLYDSVAYDHRHNEANGWDNGDGHHDNRSWNSGWEGDDGVPHDVMALRRRRMRNAMCLLLLSGGVPMWVAGDEFARTQGGNNNPYNQDNETSWIDWERRDAFGDLETFIGRLTGLRAAQPALAQLERWAARVRWFGAVGGPDTSFESRSLAWHLDGVYVMANMWWEPLVFDVQAAGRWVHTIDTSADDGIGSGNVVDGRVAVGPRSIVVLTCD